MNTTYERLLAVTPIDGRYGPRTTELRPITSEFGLIKYRLQAMAGWFGQLQSGVLPDVPQISDGAQDALHDIVSNFSVEDAAEVKEIEAETNHDVKAVEVFLRRKIEPIPELHDNQELIHFGCTSEDVNNVAYAMMMKDARDGVLDPNLTFILQDLANKAEEWSDVPLLSLTHGQPATPTTLGKEMGVFLGRLYDHQQALRELPIRAKWNGATGNYAAGTIAYPEIDWSLEGSIFIRDLGFTPNQFTTQIEPHDWMVRYFNEIALGDSIKMDLVKDMWGYISRGIIAQKTKAEETGSSTMPHKVNPIDFENAESNAETANGMAQTLARKLPVSRFQRDLSDSSSLRTIGELLGHTLVADKSLLKGLGKISANGFAANAELAENWAVLTEAVQTVMRRHKVPNAYGVIKDATRGVEFSQDDYVRLVESVDIPGEAKDALRELTPQTYIGRSSELAAESIAGVR